MAKRTTDVIGHTWGIKGIERETRTLIKKVAKKEGKTIAELFNTTVREYMTAKLQEKEAPAIPPAKIEDMNKAIETIRGRFSEIDELKAEVDQLKNRRSVFGNWFGKK